MCEILIQYWESYIRGSFGVNIGRSAYEASGVTWNMGYELSMKHVAHEKKHLSTQFLLHKKRW
jgi:hypothetical protein